MTSFCRRKQLSVKDETYENIDSEVDEDDLYDIDKMSLDKKEWRNHTFEGELEKYMMLKYIMVCILYMKNK